MTVGEAIKANRITREQVEKLAATLFDGKTAYDLDGAKIVPPALKSLTAHVREMVMTALLLGQMAD